MENILGRLQMGKEMVKAFKNTTMGIFIEATLRIIIGREMGNIYIQMVLFEGGNGIKVNFMGKVNKLLEMYTIKDNSKWEQSLVMEKPTIYIRERAIKAIIKMERSMGKEKKLLQKIIIYRVILLTAY